MQIKYELCNLETLEGIERAEQLKDDGWTTCESSPFSVMMKKEDTNGQREEYPDTLSGE